MLKRYPWGNLKEDRMTIGVGILCQNAVVIASDTQIGDSDLKTGQFKLASTSKFGIGGDRSDLVVAGASNNLRYLKHLQGKIVKMMHPRNQSILAPRLEDLEKQVSDYLGAFYLDHVQPFSTWPDKPDVSLLIGYSQGNVAKLWSSDKNVLTEHESFAAVGSGEMFALLLLNRLFYLMFPMDLKTAVLLAAYVVFQVKQHVYGCGKDTDIRCVGTDRPVFLTRKQTRALDTIFEEITKTESELIGHILGSAREPAPKQILRRAEKFRSRLSKVPIHFSKSINSESSQT
jgi:20S proteasome alpha/beta subunit